MPFKEVTSASVPVSAKSRDDLASGAEIPVKRAYKAWWMMVLTAVILSTGFSLYYTRHWNPEIGLYLYAARLKCRYAEALEQRTPTKVAFFGGSSCAFGVDTELMNRDYHLPAVNLGLHAGLGAPVLTAFALDRMKPKDTLIVSLEPQLLIIPFDYPALGDQFSLDIGHPEYMRGGPLGLARRGMPGFLLAPRPGAENLFNYIQKRLRHQQMVYSKQTFTPSGWQRLDQHAEPQSGCMLPSLSADGDRLLSRLAEYCRSHEIRLAYAMPWIYYAPSAARLYRPVAAQYLLCISKWMPVLRDSTLGLISDPDDFADGPLHLRPRSAEQRARILAEAVTHWDTWKPVELQQIVSAN